MIRRPSTRSVHGQSSGCGHWDMLRGAVAQALGLARTGPRVTDRAADRLDLSFILILALILVHTLILDPALDRSDLSGVGLGLGLTFGIKHQSQP